MPLRLPSIAVVASGMLVGACIAIDPDAQLCAVGADGCACTLGGACDPGLACVEGSCVPPGSSSSTGSRPDDEGSSSKGDEESQSGADTLENSSTSTTAPEQPPNRVFVTSTLHTAALGGLEGADEVCQARAAEAGLPGTYRAWLSAPGEDARDRLEGARGWVRTDGLPFAEDLEQVLVGAFYHPPITDEHGVLVPVPDFIWTATSTEGVLITQGNVGTCEGWTQGDPAGAAAYGNLGAATGWWTLYDALPCNDTARLLCFGIDHDHDLAFEPAAGRAAFVSSNLVPADAGPLAADGVCQAEAEQAGLDGTFLALLATRDALANAGFAIEGEPWVRADGVPIFPEGEVFGRHLATPILYGVDGEIAPLALAWSGAQILEEMAFDNCSDWTSTTGYAWMFSTVHVFWQSWTLGNEQQECAAGPYPVLCFEQ